MLIAKKGNEINWLDEVNDQTGCRNDIMHIKCKPTQIQKQVLYQ